MVRLLTPVSVASSPMFISLVSLGIVSSSYVKRRISPSVARGPLPGCAPLAHVRVEEHLGRLPVDERRAHPLRPLAVHAEDLLRRPPLEPPRLPLCIRLRPGDAIAPLGVARLPCRRVVDDEVVVAVHALEDLARRP